MKREYTYEQIIGNKLNRLTPPDVAGLWDSMEEILDREMPQQEKKSRRTGAWWLNTNLLVAASIFVAIGSVYTLCHVSGRTPVVQANIELANGEVVNERSVEVVAMPKVEALSGTADGSSMQKENRIAETIADNHERSKTVVGFRKAGAAARNNATEPVKKAASVTSVASVEEILAVNSTSIAEEAFFENAAETALVEPLKEAAPVQATVPAVFNLQNVNAVASVSANIAKQKKQRFYSDKGFVLGASMSLPVELNQQRKSELNMSGQMNQWQDYVPSVYAQLHLSKKFYVQAEWQPVTAQYTPNFTLYDRTDVLNPDEKEQRVVKLNKLFYNSLPFSLHYNTPLKNVTVGVGVQYSRLKKVILQDQEHYHLIQAGGVFKVEERKDEVAVRDPEKVRSHSTGDVVDSVATSIRREDWRLLADVGYHYKGFNFGVRYTQGVRNYINSNFTNLPVKDRNEALQVYLRFNLFDGRKK